MDDRRGIDCCADYGRLVCEVARQRQRRLAFRVQQHKWRFEDRKRSIEWLSAIHYELCLDRANIIPTEAVYRAIGILDRFTLVVQLDPAKYVQVSAACFIIACKCECPGAFKGRVIGEKCGFGATGYRQVWGLEREILARLRADVAAFPTALWFLSYMLCRDAMCDQYGTLLARYFLGEVIMSEVFFDVLPVEQAAAALCLARHVLGSAAWGATLVESSGLVGEAVVGLAIKARDVVTCARGAGGWLERKYSQDAFLRVAEAEIPSF